ncbi:unnamed protein product [Heterobilharzia americana]|nr:unnamed protein product [Heterobilharzia americana]
MAMSLLKGVHHVRFATRSLWQMYETLTQGFGFTFHCLSKHGSKLNLVLKNGQTVVMLSETHSPPNPYHPLKFYSKLSNWVTEHDGPFDISLEVENVHEVCERVTQFSGLQNILLEPTTYTDYHGKVILGVIKSCVGNLLHTVIDSSHYNGLFLPGYILPELGTNDDLKKKLYKHQSNSQLCVKYIDHIALAGENGNSNNFIKWYETVFGMKRVFVNLQEDESQGFLVKFKNTGMKLKAMCQRNSPMKSGCDNTCKFVFVEPVKDSEPNQVTRFLHANSGPGLQHMAFAVDNITGVTNKCCENGVKFINPPDTYYDMLTQRIDLEQCCLNLEELKTSRVLVDKEIDINGNQIGTLLQIFTEPLFEKNGFFMELIERRNQSTGFGENNINALWEALELSQTIKNRTVNRLPSN